MVAVDGDDMKIQVNGNTYDVEMTGEIVKVNGREIAVKVNDEDRITIGKKTFYLDFLEEGEPSLMIINGMTYVISKGPLSYVSPKEIKTPISGKVVDVFVNVGAEVKPGNVLMVIEAMKMENQIKSPLSGIIKEISVSKDQSVKVDEVLVTFK
jgi:biotin carboxyl carrier protein